MVMDSTACPLALVAYEFRRSKARTLNLWQCLVGSAGREILMNSSKSLEESLTHQKLRATIG